MVNKFTISLLPISKADLIEIYTYVAYSDGIEQARKTKDLLKEKIKSLSTLPERGKYPPELLNLGICQYRELIVYPWRIFYEVIDNHIDIVSILDGRRAVEQLLMERLLRT